MQYGRDHIDGVSLSAKAISYYKPASLQERWEGRAWRHAVAAALAPLAGVPLVNFGRDEDAVSCQPVTHSVWEPDPDGVSDD